MLTKDISKKLFLLDAYALIYRAYFAFSKNPRINSKGQNTSAAFGFTNALIDILNREKPTHLAVVFDPPGGATQRQEEFSEYKANREKMPEDIREMILPIKNLIRAFNIPVIEVAGFEADDVVGTLAKIADEKGFTTYMMTPDKDYCQLVSETSFIYKPGRGGAPAQVLGIKEVCEKFEIKHPKQVIDILGMWGDSSDNIPGIPGIGEKTAKKLINKYDSLENLLQNTEDLKGKQKENVEKFADQGIMSKMLATIILDVDVEFNESELKLKPFDKDKIINAFTELEFRNLAKRVLGEDISISLIQKTSPIREQKSTTAQLDLFGMQSMIEPTSETPSSLHKDITSEKPKYHFVESELEIKSLLSLLMAQKSVCFDTETSSLEPRHADLVGISFSFKKGEAYYVAAPKTFDQAKKLIAQFSVFFESKKIEKVAHNMKYDLKVLSRYGVNVKGPVFDTMIANYLINPESRQSMDFLATYYLNYKPIPIESLIGKKGKNQGNLMDLNPIDIVDYACEDADITFQLKQLFEPQIQEKNLSNLFYKMEMPLVFALKEMEENGIAINSENLKSYSKSLSKDLQELEEKIKNLAGEDFNIDSPKQLGEILFGKLQINPKAKKTKSGQFATSENVLVKLKKKHPIIEFILEYRQLRKLKNTYVDPLPELRDEKDQRIHTHFMQTVTATGRLSSNNPNLQNIPIKTQKGREIRKAFVPRNSDYSLMAADYSQIELRIIAALSKDVNMIKAFEENLDIHSATASKVFAVDINKVSREQRGAAKAVNFGIIYGQSAFGLSQNLGITRTEAKEIIDNYFKQYSTIKDYMNETISLARENGYVETIMKRRRYLPDINSGNAVVRGYAERNAINAPIQGSAADIIKMAMNKVFEKMNKNEIRSKMLLQVHDELVFDIHKEEEDFMRKLVKKEMENAVNISVPLDVEIKVASNWLDAH
ncbi:MAG: DNA polymerase I [Crocinitomicaceae bacterium]|nr:DNA polymerase I [Crocinitomicaceae bacterium]